MANAAKTVELPNDIESLKRLVIEQRALLLSREVEIEKLKIELAHLKRLRFGRSSEKLDERIAQLEPRSEEHTSELQSCEKHVCRLQLGKKNTNCICL